MKWPFVTRRLHLAVSADRERIREERNQFGRDRDASVSASARVASHYNALAKVVAVHIVTAEENGVDINTATLRAALQRARIDLAIEYAHAGRDGDPS